MSVRAHARDVILRILYPIGAPVTSELLSTAIGLPPPAAGGKPVRQSRARCETEADASGAVSLLRAGGGPRGMEFEAAPAALEWRPSQNQDEFEVMEDSDDSSDDDPANG